MRRGTLRRFISGGIWSSYICFRCKRADLGRASRGQFVGADRNQGALGNCSERPALSIKSKMLVNDPLGLRLTSLVNQSNAIDNE
jgi:hypothetical protein